MTVQIESPETDSFSIWRLLAVSCVLIVVWFLSGVVVNSVWQLPGGGQIGDSFGVINSLFSGLAFTGVIFTLLMQKQELQLQRKELRQTRDELHRSAAAQEASERALVQQAELFRASVVVDIRTAIARIHADAANATVPQTMAWRTDAPQIRSLYSQIQGLEKTLASLEKSGHKDRDASDAERGEPRG